MVNAQAWLHTLISLPRTTVRGKAREKMTLKDEEKLIRLFFFFFGKNVDYKSKVFFPTCGLCNAQVSPLVGLYGPVTYYTCLVG